MRRAFAYSRFSTPEQMDGRSLQRQEEAAKAYCARHGLKLDERFFTDLGVSAYHGANATHGELGRFLGLVREGQIPKGSVLVIENVDRLSRLPPDEANGIIMEIVRAGVDVATISPEALYTAQNIRNIGTWIPLQVAQCLAAEESRKKGERVADAWAAKRAEAATAKLSKKGPSWLRLSPDRKRWTVLEDKANWVRRMFALAADGFGVVRIAEVLNRECPQGMTGRGWQPSYIRHALRSRSVLGEYQPHVGTCAKRGRKATRKPCGDAVRDYFPRILSDADFYRAQQALDGRRRAGGKVSGTPNLFNGILYDAADGQRMVITTTSGKKVLVSAGAVRKLKGSVFRSVRYEPFKQAVLSLLAELKPADVLGRHGAAEDRVAVLGGKFATVNRKLEALKARAAAEDDVTVFLDLLGDLDRQRKGLLAELEEATAEAACRRGDRLGEFTSLSQMLDDAGPDERDALRRKMRAALRRLVKEMWAVVVPTDKGRVVGLQAYFAGSDHHREFAILIRRDQWWARSLASAVKPGDLDLRNPEHAKRLEAALASVDLTAGSDAAVE
jgi:DNA invertase Pin-like site-specific DNA recombinase